MLSQQRHSPKSPASDSVQSGSIATGSINNANEHNARRSSSSDESNKVKGTYDRQMHIQLFHCILLQMI